jgi:hypothetical protein
VQDPAARVIKKEIWCVKCDKTLELFDKCVGLLPYLSLEKAKLRPWAREGLMRVQLAVLHPRPRERQAHFQVQSLRVSFRDV